MFQENSSQFRYHEMVSGRRPALTVRTALRAGADCQPPDCSMCPSAEAQFACQSPPCTPPYCGNCSGMEDWMACFYASQS